MKLTIQLTDEECTTLTTKAAADGAVSVEAWAKRRLLEAEKPKPVHPFKAIKRVKIRTPGAGEY